MVGIVIPFDVALLLTVFVAFTLPKLYEMQQNRIDEFVEVVKEKLQPLVDKAQPIVDVLIEKFEPIIGSW